MDTEVCLSSPLVVSVSERVTDISCIVFMLRFSDIWEDIFCTVSAGTNFLTDDLRQLIVENPVTLISVYGTFPNRLKCFQNVTTNSFLRKFAFFQVDVVHERMTI